MVGMSEVSVILTAAFSRTVLGFGCKAFLGLVVLAPVYQRLRLFFHELSIDNSSNDKLMIVVLVNLFHSAVKSGNAIVQ
jgi:hypothetical protein